MEKRAKLTSKGQVTIPLEIRRAMGVKTGSDIIFESNETGIHVRPGQKESALAKYVGIERKGKGLTREQIIRQVRQLRGHE